MTLEVRSLIRLLYRSPLAHRALPLSLARRVVAARARRSWEHNPALREDALLHMQYLLGNSSRAAEVKALAPVFLHETYKRSEALFRPSLSAGQDVVGRGVGRLAHERGRGLILSYMHHGIASGYYGLAKLDLPLHAPINSAFLQAKPNSPIGRYVRYLRRSGVHPFASEGAYPHMRELLRDNQVIAIAMDVPGSLPMTFLGRDVLVASGTAALASETGALVAPMTSHRVAGNDWSQVIHLEPHIDPYDFSSPVEIQAELARRFEPSVLEWPETLLDPLRRWTPQDPAEAKEFGLAAGSARFSDAGGSSRLSRDEDVAAEEAELR